MEISSQGVKAATLNDKLKAWTKHLQVRYGNDFAIKKEGVISNLATGVSAASLDFESILLFLIKNLNPYTSEDEFQDNLYSLIGLERTLSTYTVAQRTIQGKEKTSISAGSIIFKNASTEDQFELISDVTLNEKGIGVGTFRAVELGAIQLDNDATCSIVSAPATVTGVYYEPGNITNVGLDYQSNSEFREEWLQEQSLAVAHTEGGIKKALLPYCGKQSANIRVRMNRGVQTFPDVPLHSANIVVYSAYDDKTIANVIFDKLTDGLGLSGNITETVIDSEGNPEEILFSRAKEKKVNFKVVVKLEEDYTLSAAVKNSIKDAIINNLKLNMGTSVIANKAVKFIDDVEGVDYVTEIAVSTNASDWKPLIEITDIEVATIGDINVSI